MTVSAGLLMYRRRDGALEVLVVHPGGPFFRKRSRGWWSIPKGLVDDEDLLTAAQREFAEETGLTPSGEFLSLGSIRQKGGKVVHAWAFEGDCDPAAIRSNTFRIEWPRGGKEQEFPEIDEARFVDVAEARELLLEAQRPFVDRLVAMVE